MSMFLSRLNAPHDGPRAWAEDLKAVHVSIDFDGNYATGGYDLTTQIKAMYGLGRVQYAICHNISWINSLTASVDGQKLAYMDLNPLTNKLLIKQFKADAAAGDPEIANGLAVSDAVFSMTLLCSP